MPDHTSKERKKRRAIGVTTPGPNPKKLNSKPPKVKKATKRRKPKKTMKLRSIHGR